MYEKAFKKDWDALKKELAKLGVKKPAVSKKIAFIEKRVASGIGAAMKAIDAADPGDLKKVTDKTLGAYKKGLKDLETAIGKELAAIQTEITNIKELEKGEKDSSYRGLKVFKAKLEDYLAQAQARFAEMETARSSASLGEKAIKLFKPKLKAALTNVVAGIKKVKIAPSVDTYNSEIVEPVVQLELAVDQGATIDSWDNKRWISKWVEFRKQVTPLKHPIKSDKEIPEKLKSLATLVKKIMGHLEEK